MKTSYAFGFAAISALVFLLAGDALGRGGLGGVGGGGGRGGGGGGRPSMGGGGRPGGGMSRPSGGMSRPSGGSRPSMARPSPRPSGGGMNRPSLPTVSRPSGSARPGGGISRPGGAGGIGGFSPSGGRPATRPATRPSLPGGSGAGIASRPSVSQPGNLRPATRPSLPGAGGGGIQRPGAGVGRPGGPGGIGRPGGDIGRPGGPGGIGGIGSPGGINRPSIGGIGGPGGIGGIGDVGRPGGIGGIGDAGRPGRPVIGGGGNNINRPGGDNIHIGDNNLINRPGWGLDHPGGDWWSQNHNHWHDNWHDHCIHDHYHGWYNGCWNGNWGNNWWAPVGWATVGWGLGNWGYGGYSEPYYNPYYTESAAPAYDYSQPVVVNYVSSDSDSAGGAATAQAPPADPPETQQAMKLFDEGMAAFKAGSYPQALAKYEAALKLMPGDPVLHEVRALTLFALGQYDEAAAALNALLASSPGMDWTSMSSLYGNANDYTQQLRKLEAHIKANPKDAPAIFVLAYHYLVIGQNDEAIKALREVVRLQPKDATAQRMLAALSPPAEKPVESEPAPAANAPTTDLVGTWKAKAGNTTIELTIDDKFQFTWKAKPKGQPAVELTGTVNIDGDLLALENKEQGNMVGQVKSGGPDKFTFALQGQPADSGLAFQRAG